MTVYRRGRVWHYDFWYKGDRYRGSTGQLTKDDAKDVETREQQKVRRKAAGLEAEGPGATPTFQDWAEVYYEQRARHVTRPETIEDLVRVLLRFFGAQPDQPIEGEPYHNLRLGDIIQDPSWLERFELWMRARGIAAQTRNHYRSQLSQMYKLASSPTFRARTRVHSNPLAGVGRDSVVPREVVMTADELRRFLAVAAYHVRLAVAIGALAPKLRLANILGLRWSEHFDPDLAYITVHDHKTAVRTKKPLVIPITEQLRTILQDARRRHPESDVVVSYRKDPLTQIRGGVQAAARRAGLTYGRFMHDGLTFHTLRHTAATVLAELGVSEQHRKELMGHASIQTTQRYTHLRPVHLRAPAEQLSAALPIADLVMLPWKRIPKAKKGDAA